MLVSVPDESVVLKLSNPNRVLQNIPSAHKWTAPGKGEFVRIPHTIDNARALAALGMPAPSPIRYHYRWPGEYTPFYAQTETAAFLTMHPRAFVLNDMGTGKTMSALWAYDYLRQCKLVKRMLVVAPLSTLERTWADEVFVHFPHLNLQTLHGTKEKRLKLLALDADIYVINHDGLSVLEDELIARTDIDVVLIDELAVLRNGQSKRWKAVNRVCKGRSHVWGMTGTPTPNLPTDAWAQCRLISPERVPPYFGRFKDMVLRQAGPFAWVPRPTATDTVADAMQPAVRFTRDQCVDLPPCMYEAREAEQTPEQKKAYREMKAELTTEVGTDTVRALNEAVKMSKLVQIACGVVYGADGSEVVLPCMPRINVVKEVIEQAGGKVIVFVPYKAVIRHVADELAKDFGVAVISGDVVKSQRDDIFSRFQRDDKLQVLVAQPAAMSHGLTLTAANTIVWYAPVTSNETYEQANARIVRPGQKRTQFIIHIEATEVERKIYDRLQKKQTMQGLLLDVLAS